RTRSDEHAPDHRRHQRHADRQADLCDRALPGLEAPVAQRGQRTKFHQKAPRQVGEFDAFHGYTTFPLVQWFSGSILVLDVHAARRRTLISENRSPAIGYRLSPIAYFRVSPAT